MKSFRAELWHNILEDLGPEPGCYLPSWLVVVHCILFPLDGLRHWLKQSQGYDLMLNQWTIYGVKYSDAFFYHMSRASGQVFRIERIGDSLTVTNCEPKQASTQWRP